MNKKLRDENFKLGAIWGAVLCLALSSGRGDESKKAEPKYRIRMFRPMIPIVRSSGNHEKVATGKLTISTPNLIPPPPIPSIIGDFESGSTEEADHFSLQESLEASEDADIDKRNLSRSDLPPDRNEKKSTDESTPPESKKKKKAKPSSYRPPTSIAEISGPPTLENLRASAHVLAREGLDYKFGRDNPKQGGMDCSSSLQFLLTRIGIKNVPRTSYDQYDWLKNKKLLDDVYGKQASSKLFKKLSPGDLIFWGGTWKSGHRVSHVMMYMGYDPETKKHYVFGARSKSSKGLLGHGVDVFELEPSRGRLIAHGKIPGLTY